MIHSQRLMRFDWKNARIFTFNLIQKWKHANSSAKPCALAVIVTDAFVLNPTNCQSRAARSECAVAMFKGNQRETISIPMDF